MCLADAGWFPLIQPDRGFSTWFNGVWEHGYTGHNVSVSVHPKCLSDHNATTEWMCTLPVRLTGTFSLATHFLIQI